MAAHTDRFKSRILREKFQHRDNPFNSPPSSTGSHGTVTMTSDLSYDPEGESTRRMHRDDDSIQLPGLLSHHKHGSKAQSPFKVNTSAIGRNFPEWKGGWNVNSREQTEDIYNVTGDRIDQGKENIPPSSSTVASPTQAKSQTPGHFKTGGGTLRTLAQMQAQVDDDSVNMTTGSNPRRGNVTSLIQTLKAAQATRESAPIKSSPKPVNVRHSRISNTNARPSTPNQTGRSFFLPNLIHINDFVSGVLKLSSTKNGIPVFVKNGKVHDRESRTSPDHHANVDAIKVPEDEQKIFVSLDKIREEIQALQEHDDQVSRQAEILQEELYELQIQLSKAKSRKDSAMGSDSDSSMLDHLNNQKSQLEEQVASLQSRLDKANRKISINEIHTESYISERDEALKSASARLEEINRLQSELDAARREVNASRNGDAQDLNVVEAENRDLREDNISLRHQYKSMHEENQSLRSHNTLLTHQNVDLQKEVKRLQRELDSLQGENELLQKEYAVIVEEKRTIKQDNLSLERHNEKWYNDTKSLQQKVTLLEQRTQDLQDNNNQLHHMLDSVNAETGTITVHMKDVKDRIEKKTRDLTEQNAQLRQQIVELQAEYASKYTSFEQEKRRLVGSNERLNDKLDHISKQFEQIVCESKEEAAKYEEMQSSLTQQLEDLKTTPTTTTTSKTKPVKVTRIIEPTTSASKHKSTLSEMSARSTTSQTDFQMQDDYTRHIDLTQDSDFATNMSREGKIDKLRDALRQAQLDAQQQDEPDEYADLDEAAITEDMSRSLPSLPQTRRNDSIAFKSKNTTSKGQTETSKAQPLGILKNVQTPRQIPEQDLTGRFSVKSGMSGMSLPSQASPPDLSHGRRHSDSVRFDLNVNVEETSALFMDDITLDSRKRAVERQEALAAKKGKATPVLPKNGAKKAIPTLSKDAKRVLDSLCHDHDCRNCIVCKRINSHMHEDETTRTGVKTTVRVEKPIPVTDRIPNSTTDSAYEDQPTLRPAQHPGLALATVMKGLRDELAHLEAKYAKKNAIFAAMDPSFGRRERKGVTSEIQTLMRAINDKQDMIYRLHDVLEGQKASGQQMTEDEVDVTIMSILSKDKEVTWDGIVD
ncbi:uncharacterized protein BCR38DRAFT_108524 [Pseudomassariella vexata]|uniref:Cep57 centrosome microtubule-binding domain-containing protein n=1 Tax=Pseudomassariella vexata TaxID=1141098 RepID=A0A1Y2DD03_9PEZI|nr:uncharacterized protein BCR38DRAFT_108524 [Pseudomassariella vexata]ORY57163.1 hypothetical protein BCR38DRAFT_108524 [Pseudomassariella vexata]